MTIIRKQNTNKKTEKSGLMANKTDDRTEEFKMKIHILIPKTVRSYFVGELKNAFELNEK